MDNYNISIESVFTDRPIITLGLAAASLLTTVAINFFIKDRDEEEKTLVIDDNFIEQMKAGNLNIEEIAKHYQGNVKVADELIENIKSGKTVLTQQDIEQLSPVMVITFEQPAAQPIQPVAPQTQMLNQQPQVAPQQPVQPVQFVGNPVPVQQVQVAPGAPIQPVQQMYQVPQQQPVVINGQVSPVPAQ